MNFYKNLDWSSMLRAYPDSDGRKFEVKKYHKILSAEYPDFLDEYVNTPAMQRLKGIGLLCGTDWTSLYKNRFYYSRLDHSIGVALIVYNFTKDKKQTLAGLFHDISTPIFSHVAEFRKGDALTQSESENQTEHTIRSSKEICALLKKDCIEIEEISDYHVYPVADNNLPQLSADRLEYMFPSGAALQGSWSLDEVKQVYQKIAVLKNENGIDELGFTSVREAEIYCKKFLETGHVLQLNENKLTLQLLAEITSLAIKLQVLSEEDCLKISEKEAFQRFEEFACKKRGARQDDHYSLQNASYSSADLPYNRKNEPYKSENSPRKAKIHPYTCENANTESARFKTLLNTFLRMTKIQHSEKPIADHFCVNVQVKQRYINPLVKVEGKTARLSSVSKKTADLIDDFLSYSDTPFGCVKML